MFHERNKINLPSVFGTFFLNKVASITDHLNINPNVYNGTCKVNVENQSFMSSTKILDVISSIKIKNSKGFDRIPQRILVDGASILIEPLSKLFEKIYNQKTIPEQWLIAKIVPTHKKDPNKILKIIALLRTFVRLLKFLKE